MRLEVAPMKIQRDMVSSYAGCRVRLNRTQKPSFSDAETHGRRKSNEFDHKFGNRESKTRFLCFFGSPKIPPNEARNVGKIINGVDEVVLNIKPPKQK